MINQVVKKSILIYSNIPNITLQYNTKLIKNNVFHLFHPYSEQNFKYVIKYVVETNKTNKRLS